jgi:hypothetical protein
MHISPGVMRPLFSYAPSGKASDSVGPALQTPVEEGFLSRWMELQGPKVHSIPHFSETGMTEAVTRT